MVWPSGTTSASCGFSSGGASAAYTASNSDAAFNPRRTQCKTLSAPPSNAVGRRLAHSIGGPAGGADRSGANTEW